MLFRSFAFVTILMAVSACTFSQSLKLKNLRGRDPENRTIYLGLSNAFKVTGMQAGTKIMSATIGWRIKGDTLMLMPAQAGMTLLSIKSEGENYNFAFDAKRLPDPFVAR